jgi:hypothetical protein
VVKDAQITGPLDSLNIQGEFDGISRRARPQIVLTSLESQLPSMEMGRGELVESRISHVDIQALRLTDEWGPSTS